MKIAWFLDKELDNCNDRAYGSEISRLLSDKGHSVQLIARYRKKRINFNVPLLYLPVLPFKGGRWLSYIVLAAIYMLKIILTWKPDVIIIDRPFICVCSIPSLIITNLMKMNVKFILDVRSPPVGEGVIKDWIFKIGLIIARHSFSGCMTITSSMRSIISKISGIPENEIALWSSGFNECLFDPDSKSEVLDWPFFKEHFVIIYHGAISEKRGLEEVIYAMKYVKPNIRLFIIGEGSQRENLIKLVERLELREKIVIHTPVSYWLIPLYIKKASAGIIALPDLWWWQVSSPLKLIEYMAMAKPVIVTPIEAHRSIINESSDAIFITMSELKLDSSFIADAINYAESKWGNSFYSQINRIKALNEFTWKKQVSNIEAYLSKENLRF